MPKPSPWKSPDEMERYAERTGYERYPQQYKGRPGVSGKPSEGEFQFREFMGERIMGVTGFLDGEGKGLYSLNTLSLEKLYEALLRSNPAHDFERQR